MLNGFVKLDYLGKWHLSVVGTFALAVFLATGNHFFCVYLDNKDVSLYNQSWVTMVKNTWARAVQICLIVSSHTAFLAMIWSGLYNHRLPVRIVDSVLRLPAFLPLLKILFSPALKRLSNPVFYSVCLFSLAFVTITVPAALVVRPMESLPATLQVPRVDMSNDPSLYAVMTPNWEYLGPSYHIQRLVRNMLTSNTVLTWNAPSACNYGCSYDIIYDAPVLRCVDYTPGPDDIALNASYRASFDISESHPMLNVIFWPMANGTRTIGDTNSSPLGTRCTFHQGKYTAAIDYWGSRQNALITNYTHTSDDSLLGTSLGFSNSSSCPRKSSWTLSDPSSISPCARTQMNTWAVIEAFSSAISGAIVTYSQSRPLGPEERAMNSALMPNLDHLLSVRELYQSFDIAPWVKKAGLGVAFSSLFSNATLSLTVDAYTQNWTSEAHDAFIVPFANKYSYDPRTLWWGYGCAFLTVISTLTTSWVARKRLPNEKSRLGRILATTRDKSFDQLQDRNEDIDELLICYEQVKKGDDHIMAFTMRGEGQGLRKRSSDTEEMGLLERT